MAQEGGARLLAGGNPQIPLGYGEGPVRAYLDAAPGWKAHVARRMDELIVRTVPGVRKAVKYNSPLYGVEEGRWFLSLHLFNRFVRVAFFQGTELDPMPPGASKIAGTRYLDLYEEGPFDEGQITAWIEAASGLPGERL